MAVWVTVYPIARHGSLWLCDVEYHVMNHVDTERALRLSFAPETGVGYRCTVDGSRAEIFKGDHTTLLVPVRVNSVAVSRINVDIDHPMGRFQAITLPNPFRDTVACSALRAVEGLCIDFMDADRTMYSVVHGTASRVTAPFLETARRALAHRVRQPERAVSRYNFRSYLRRNVELAGEPGDHRGVE